LYSGLKLGSLAAAVNEGPLVTLSIDVFWSFRSPYSYLATPRLAEMAQEYDLIVNARPVYPLAVRSGEFFSQVNPLWVPYLMKDTVRLAEMLGLPYRWPRPDPVAVDFATRAATPNQRFIHRLTRLGCAAAEAGRGLQFLKEVSHTIWSGTIDNWHEGPHLGDAAARAGLDLAELDKKVAGDPDTYEAIIQANQAAHQACGHWGVPTMAFEGEPFFGQDRLDVLLWRLKQKGLEKR
jgi:2-hydroxychromene-2-carboxylate isomerase